jgi:hypothetical protein
MSERNHTSRWNHVFVILFIGVIAVNVYFWYGKYHADLQTSHDQGFLVGYTEGNQTGYDLGYYGGNQSGYLLGYDAGRISGYQHGYNAGNASGYQTGYAAGHSAGYAVGYDAGYLQGVDAAAGTGYVLRDPTYTEAIHFIAADPTDTNEYTDTYQCRHFAADVVNHAFDAGFESGYVYVGFPEGAHAIICFNTTDSGLLFIEPQDDAVVQVVVGQPYWDRTKYHPAYDDTVVEYLIIW